MSELHSCSALRIPRSEAEKSSTQFFLCKVVVCAKTVPYVMMRKNMSSGPLRQIASLND